MSVSRWPSVTRLDMKPEGFKYKGKRELGQNTFRTSSSKNLQLTTCPHICAVQNLPAFELPGTAQMMVPEHKQTANRCKRKNMQKT